MITVTIPSTLPEIKTPKIPFTDIPNPLGAAKIYEGNGIVHHVPLYYLQVAVRFVCLKMLVYLKIIATPFIKLYHRKWLK